MPKSSEEISKSYANGGGKTDSNLANDALHLGGIPAEDYATQRYVQEYVERIRLMINNYLDTQDIAILQQAKAYTDLMINSQDFSNFAKLTDLQALRTNIETEIQRVANEQKSYTDTKISAVVTDVNRNFDNVGQSITNLNNITQQLFQSVSNGKSKIAGAITDKGISTSANDSFDTMAGNIRNIPTSGGEIDENFVNTADGTAEANDILLGKIAYVKGKKIYGMHVDSGTDTSDADATASDILLGKSAYVDGMKIHGTLIARAEEGMPTYGTDTSDATATSNDILYGKTAYARGQLLVGTLQNTDVEEIYGNSGEAFNYDNQSIITTDPKTQDTIRRDLVTFSKDLSYCVSLVKLNDDTAYDYIESHAVGENGLYIQESANISGNVNTKKYRYTKQELGLDGEEILDIAFGSPGLDGNSKKCLLMIATQKPNEEKGEGYYDLIIHLYTYHLSDNGQIGKTYDKESVINIQHSITIDNGYDNLYCRLISFNNRYNEFQILCRKRTSNPLYLYSFRLYNNAIIQQNHITYNPTQPSYIDRKKSEITVSNDDKYIYFSNKYGDSYSYKPIIYNDTSGFSYTPTFGGLFDTSTVLINIEGTNTFIGLRGVQITLYTLEIVNNLVSLTDTGFTVNVTYDMATTLRNTGIDTPVCGIITSDNKKIVVIMSAKNGAYTFCDTQVKIYDVDTILNADSGDTIEHEQKFYLNSYSNSNNSPYSISTNTSRNIFLISECPEDSSNLNGLHKVSTSINRENIIGLKYKGEYFYNMKPNILTAGQPDVKEGKTFLGWMGYPETGTMEV